MRLRYLPNEVKWKRARVSKNNTKPTASFRIESRKRRAKMRTHGMNVWVCFCACVRVCVCVGSGYRLSAHVLFVFCSAGDNGNAMYEQVRCAVCQCVCIAHSNARTCYMLLVYTEELAYAMCVCLGGQILSAYAFITRTFHVFASRSKFEHFLFY